MIVSRGHLREWAGGIHPYRRQPVGCGTVAHRTGKISPPCPGLTLVLGGDGVKGPPGDSRDVGKRPQRRRYRPVGGGPVPHLPVQVVPPRPNLTVIPQGNGVVGTCIDGRNTGSTGWILDLDRGVLLACRPVSQLPVGIVPPSPERAVLLQSDGVLGACRTGVGQSQIGHSEGMVAQALGHVDS